MATFAEDAINRPTFGMTQRGRAEILQGYRAWLASNTVELVSQTTEEVFVRGDLAVEFGSLEQRVTPVDGEGALHRARYVSVYGNLPDGAWKLIRWMAQY